MLQFSFFFRSKSLVIAISFLFSILFIHTSFASNNVETDTIGFNRYKGKVIDSKTKKSLIFASLNVNESNISTVTNSQGEFLLKVPKKLINKSITVSFLGYTSSVYKLSDLNEKINIIKLDTHIEELSEVNIVTKDALAIVKQMLKQKRTNYFDKHTNMTAFYRETIQKRKTYVSLSEAVVDINKQPYTSGKRDILQLYKSRKSTDYRKLDTIAFKLRGGPFSTVYMDIMKYDLFHEGFENEYNFSFGKSTKIDNRPIYVINFKQNRFTKDPLYYGKLYIDAQSLALTSAKFYLNLNNINEARKFFIVKKPRNAKVTPIQAEYKVDFRVKDGKWHYGYSRIQLGFKVNWDKRWFNTIYYSTMEMAITDWKTLPEKPVIKFKDRLKTSVIMSDEASGFSDPDFWGTYNVIEPEKPIETAIKKIQKQLKRKN